MPSASWNNNSKANAKETIDQKRVTKYKRIFMLRRYLMCSISIPHSPFPFAIAIVNSVYFIYSPAFTMCPYSVCRMSYAICWLNCLLYWKFFLYSLTSVKGLHGLKRRFFFSIFIHFNFIWSSVIKILHQFWVRESKFKCLFRLFHD